MIILIFQKTLKIDLMQSVKYDESDIASDADDIDLYCSSIDSEEEDCTMYLNKNIALL